MIGRRRRAGCTRRCTLNTRSERFRRVDALFDEALDLPADRQTAFVENACADDPELAREVLGLLRAQQSSAGFLDTPALQFAAPFFDAAEVLGSGTPGRVGPFRIVGMLGRGGMGEVFLAQRDDDQFEQRVALKLIQRGAASHLHRFLDERRILARLEHPGIARLIDGGLTEHGQPYFAMELVEGEPIDRFCDSHNLDVEGRLQLFSAVCDAVSYAHQHLVIHRDIKPSNILVTPNGQVKLLDFGIAKMLDAPAAHDATRTGLYVLTPEFAAPEQVRGEPVSTATDVYALGVLLYLLLTGKRPYDVRGKSPGEIERVIADVEPPRPSTVVDHARARELRGDLDAIVLKALRKEPARRYPSVSALLEDLARFRSGLPVQARPSGAGYRVRKFVRRNRTGVAAAAVAVSALLAATAFSAAQMRVARRERDFALQEAKRQEAMVEVQTVLGSDSRGDDGQPLSAVQRIQLGEQVLVRKFAAEPWLITEGMTELAMRLFEMGELEVQRDMLARAYARAVAASLPDQVAMIECRRAYSFVYDDHYDSARVALERAWTALAPAHAGAEHVESYCLNAAGQLQVAENRPDSGVVLLTRALELKQNGRGASNRLQLLNDLASALRAVGRTREATVHQRQVIHELEAGGYVGTDIMANAVSFLTSALSELGEFATVDSLGRAVIERQAAVHGRFASGVLNFLVAQAKLRMGELDSAEVWLARATRDTTEGAGRLVAYLPPAVTQLRLEQGRFADARASLKALPSGTFQRRAYRSWFTAWLEYGTGDRRTAMLQLEDSLRVQNGSASKPHPALAPILATAAEWRLAAGDPHAADSLAVLARSAAAVDSLALQRSAHAGRAELVRARAFLALNDRNAARLAADRAIVAMTNGYGPTNARTRAAQAFRASLID